MKKILRRVFAILAVAMLVRGCVLEPVRIADDAMAPGLWEGDVILISKLSYGLRIPGPGAIVAEWRDVKKGDLVMVAEVGEPPITVVRRILALPGESVELPALEGGNRALRSNEYLVVMDQKPKEFGGRDMKTLVTRQAIVGKAWRIWIPADSKVESGEPRSFLQRI